MEFFKGLCILFASYTCMPIMFPIFEGFKIQENPLKKTQMSVILGILLTTALSIISIICSYLINHYSPEELIIFRKNKNNSKDILMIIINFILIICILLTIPRYYLMLKINFKTLFFKNNKKLSDKLNNIFTFIFCFGSALASRSVNDNIGVFLNNGDQNLYAVNYHRFNTLLINNHNYKVIYYIKTENGFETNYKYEFNGI